MPEISKMKLILTSSGAEFAILNKCAIDSSQQVEPIELCISSADSTEWQLTFFARTNFQVRNLEGIIPGTSALCPFLNINDECEINYSVIVESKHDGDRHIIATSKITWKLQNLELEETSASTGSSATNTTVNAAPTIHNFVDSLLFKLGEVENQTQILGTVVDFENDKVDLTKVTIFNSNFSDYLTVELNQSDLRVIVQLSNQSPESLTFESTDVSIVVRDQHESESEYRFTVFVKKAQRQPQPRPEPDPESVVKTNETASQAIVGETSITTIQKPA